MLDVLIAQILKNCRWLPILSEGKKVSERRDNEVGAPENRIHGKSHTLTPWNKDLESSI